MIYKSFRIVHDIVNVLSNLMLALDVIVGIKKKS